MRFETPLSWVPNLEDAIQPHPLTVPPETPLVDVIALISQAHSHTCLLTEEAALSDNPAYTSQNCSNCGEVVKKSLSTRTHTCSCGCVLDRDHNAAINILRRALGTVGHTGTWIKHPNAWGDLSSTLPGSDLVEQDESSIQESPRL